MITITNDQMFILLILVSIGVIIGLLAHINRRLSQLIENSGGGCQGHKLNPETIMKAMALDERIAAANHQLMECLREDPFFSPFINGDTKDGKSLFKMDEVKVYLGKDMPNDMGEMPILQAILKKAVFEEHISQAHKIHAILKDRKDAGDELHKLKAEML